MAKKVGLSNVARVQFFANKHASLWLDVDGKRFALSQYSSTFALNEIPSATCILGTGKKINAAERDKFRPAEELAEALSGVGFAKAKVILKFSGTKTDWEPPLGSRGWTGKKTIFQGYYAGLTYHRVGNKIQCTVSLVHKLIDLTFGTIFSAKMHPSNPASLIRPATIATLGGCEGFGAGGSWVSTALVGEKLPGGDNPGDDPVFGSRLLKVLKCLAKFEIFELPCDGQGPSGALNGAALHVLENIESETGSLKPPLNQAPFDTAIASYIGNTLNSFRGTTFWDLLVQKWCPDFMLALSPLPSKKDGGKHNCYANIIPNMPTFDKFFKTLHLEDYVEFKMQAQQEKPLAAVGILTPIVSATGAQWTPEPKQPIKGYSCLGGQYPKVPKTQGQFLALEAPGWFQQVLEASKGASQIANGANEASNPNEKQAPRPTSYEKYKSAMTDALNNIAHVYYASNALRGHVGSFSSKLRFDIPPGAMVTLKASPEAAAGATKDLPTDLHVQITRVSYNINSDTPMARTEFQCAAIRNPAELKNQDFTLSEHPFVTGKWNGAEFVNGWGF